MKLYIDGNNMPNDGIYYLITEHGEVLASHLCSNSGFAKGDLIEDRPERQAEYKERFGDYTVAFVGEPNGLTSAELQQKHKEYITKKETVGVNENALNAGIESVYRGLKNEMEEQDD